MSSLLPPICLYMPVDTAQKYFGSLCTVHTGMSVESECWFVYTRAFSLRGHRHSQNEELFIIRPTQGRETNDTYGKYERDE